LIYYLIFIYLFIYSCRRRHHIIILGMPPDAGGDDNGLPGASAMVASSMGFRDAVYGLL
jgi:hypothetical protein